MDKIKICLAMLVSVGSVFGGAGARGETVTEFLRAFHRNPADQMERLPSEVDAHGVAHPRGRIDHRRVRRQLERKNELRNLIRRETARWPTILSGATAPADAVDKLLEPGTVVERNIFSLDQTEWRNVAVAQTPWADSYWPTYRGLIGDRYADPEYPKSKKWDVNYDYIQNYPAAVVLESGDLGRINQLSPAEKYDWVMGDAAFTLTNYSWERGKRVREKYGEVERWMGICHGWAGAAHMGAPFSPVPVTVTAVGGQAITFYPQDIKALQSMLWANAAPPSRFLGGRCEVANPEKNSRGRILDQNCFDVNPATWHLAVAHQLGRSHRSFVMDSTLDLQVWNFPLVSARYHYFHPQTLAEADEASAAMVSREGFSLDKFPEFRDPRTRWVVGIVMDATYVTEIEPAVDKVFEAPERTLRFIYDLELDENRQIVGGEWYSNAHPDFLWTFDLNALATTPEDQSLSPQDWPAQIGAVPTAWSQAAPGASARGEPLAVFLRALNQAAKPGGSGGW